MSTATLAPPDPATVTPPPRAVPAVEIVETPADVFGDLRRFTVAEYEAMLSAGILFSGEPVELLDGLVVKKMSLGLAHDHAVRVLTMRLARLLPDGWTLGPATTAVMADDSMPEPDFSVLRGGVHEFAGRRATASDTALLIEVSDSSLRRDQREKLAIYAAAGVPTYWVVNIPARQVEVYTRPAGGTYAAQAVYTPGQDVPLALDGVAVGGIPVADLFPAPEAA